MRAGVFRSGLLRFGFSGLVLATAAAIVAVVVGHERQAAAAPPQTAAPKATGVALGKSGLPIPRFVSLKAGRVNVRVGPGEDYKVAWVFTRPAFPVEVIQEFDTWRRIRDSDGSTGWVFHSLLSGKRTAVVTPWVKGDPKPVRAGPAGDAVVTAYLQPGVLGSIDRCERGWCELSAPEYSGWIEQDQLWGVYQNEEVE